MLNYKNASIQHACTKYLSTIFYTHLHHEDELFYMIKEQ